VNSQWAKMMNKEGNFLTLVQLEELLPWEQNILIKMLMYPFHFIYFLFCHVCQDRVYKWGHSLW